MGVVRARGRRPARREPLSSCHDNAIRPRNAPQLARSAWPRRRLFRFLARPLAAAREHAASSVAMCPMRVWLLFFSGLIAAYLAWTSKLFGGGASDAGAGEAGEAAHHASEKVTWRDWAKFAFDGLSGRYLYNAVTSRGADAKAKTSSARPATRARTRRDKES